MLACVAALVVGASATSAPGSTQETRTLRADAPSWFTTAFAHRVAAAGADGLPLPTKAVVPMSSLAFVGIRPGQQIIVSEDEDLLASGFSLCTANFVFSNGSQYGIGTAGHCGGVGDEVFMVFAPLGAALIGEIVKSTGDPGEKLAPDFALIAIDPALNQWVSPSMAHWGGPTGAYAGDEIVPVLHSGHGVVVGTGGTPRAGVAYQWGTEWRFEGVISPGDSGSAAVVAGGLAAGNITHISVNTGETVPAWMGGTSIAAINGLVGAWQLATCPSPIPWPAPGCPPV